jgi:hypothetical protein
MASPIVKGQAFGTTETVTAAKLQNIVDNASFKDFDGSTEVFNVSGSTDIGTCVLAGGLAVKTSTGQLQLKSQADQTVIGNVSGGAAVPTAVPIVGAAGILINDDALGTSDTKGATQGNIKAYVDSKGITQTTGTAPYYGCRAFGSFNGTDATPITAESSGNVTSIVKNSAGDYTITLTEALPTNCSVVASAGHNGGVAYGNSVDVYTTSTTEIRIQVAQKTLGPYDPSRVSFAAFG